VGDEHNEVFDSIVAAAKYWITELAIKSAEDAIRMSGWRGYSNALPYERDLRSFMGAISGQTAQEKLEMFLGVNFVARALMGGNSHNGGK
jgi:alkylation response protein AidB-like acyl-CoA dehydrogenase